MAGTVSRFSRWTPMATPTNRLIKTSQRSACGSSLCSSHFRMAQNTNAVKNELMAYTSPSTAENQKVSLKQ